ncbi:MAG: ybhS [Humibacillus sp.]|nr:ybhS [Humibacillus sp.]
MSIFLLYARRLLKRPFVLLVALVMPIVLVQGVILQYQGATSLSVAVSVPDAALRAFVVAELDAQGVGHTVVEPAARATAPGVLVSIDGSLDQVAGHPSALGAAVSYGRTNANNVLLATRMNSVVSTLSHLAANSATPAALTAAMAAYDAASPGLTVTTDVIGNSNSTVLVSSFNMIVFVMLLLTMSNILVFIKDKTSTTSQRIVISASSKLSYFAQLVGLFAAIAVAEFAVMLAAMTWLFHVPLGLSPGRVALLVVAFVLFNVFAITLGLLLVSRTTKESVGRLLVTAVTLPMAMLGGALWPLTIMPTWMQNAAQVLPTTWMTQLNGVVFSGFTTTAWEVARPLVLLVGICVVLLGALSRLPAERI